MGESDSLKPQEMPRESSRGISPRNQNPLKSRKVGEMDRLELELVAATAGRPPRTHHPRAHLRALEGVRDLGLQVN